ncbi:MULTISPECIES: polysaccharide deacetylase family protein [Pontibacillus]|uniref:Polysaccharide deacetylase family protein n=1 Tax=Pontibacillus chungwhensis TaxID=265426 RepID=A0ABY8UZ50_9BACI|nr:MULTISPECIES: polysaccharide deacetylase family protein [Pontibacillus]MCD5324287.1 polysaccharide deacetylase family protein [Pontibacillus sp. HN14]WIF97659.1 polysaccharide deacetylase family protein [Pontibacillus chungwhensis]
MRKKIFKGTFILLACLICSVIDSSFLHAEEVQVSPSKTWKVSFQTSIDQNSINQDSVYILNDQSQKIDSLHLELDETGKTLAIENTEDYPASKHYSLHITKDIESEDGVAAEEEVVLPFEVTVTNSTAKTRTFTPESKLFVYDSSLDSNSIIGILYKGHTYTILDESTDYYFIQYGNGRGKIEKTEIPETKEISLTPLQQAATYTNKMMVTTKRANVYTAPNGDSDVMASISYNMRYPVTSHQGQWYEVHVGNQTGYIKQDAVADDPGIPILLYHHIMDEPIEDGYGNNKMIVRTDAFQSQATYISEENYETITLRQIEDYLYHKQNLPRKVVAITFDDGIVSTMTKAYPALENYGLKATQFNIAGRTFDDLSSAGFGTIGFQEMNEMDDVYNYQSHSYSAHYRLSEDHTPALVDMNYSEVLNDTIKSREKISQGLNEEDYKDVRYYAYPYGQYDEEVLQAFPKTGITLAVTTRPGYVHMGDDPLLLNRQYVYPSHTMKEFAQKLEATY